MKCLILGAGATAYCDIANPDRRPPLINRADFLRIFENLISGTTLTSPFGVEHFVPFMRALFNRYISLETEQAPSDIEELCTILFLLSLETSADNLVEAFQQHYQRINQPWLYKGIEIARLVSENRSAYCVVPRNILTMLTDALREEIIYCLNSRHNPPIYSGTWLVSQDHLKLSEVLEPGDTVISFNYDPLMDEALLHAGLLNQHSFDNQFRSIILPEHLICPPGNEVKLIKPHGSFTWYTDPEQSFSPREVVINFTHQYNDTFAVPHPVILPYYFKADISHLYPIARSEFQNAMTALNLSDEVILIGKQFQSGDRDLQTLIQNACNTRIRKAVYVDPKSHDADWVALHNLLFNANQTECYTGLAEYIRFLEGI